jgi:hypothetical protein
LSTIKKSLRNWYRSTSQTFVGSLTSVKGTLREEKSMQAFLHLSQTSL